MKSPRCLCPDSRGLPAIQQRGRKAKYPARPPLPFTGHRSQGELSLPPLTPLASCFANGSAPLPQLSLVGVAGKRGQIHNSLARVCHAVVVDDPPRVLTHRLHLRPPTHSATASSPVTPLSLHPMPQPQTLPKSTALQLDPSLRGREPSGLGISGRRRLGPLLTGPPLCCLCSCAQGGEDSHQSPYLIR